VVAGFPGASRCSDRESGDRPLGWEWVPLSVEGSGRGAYRGAEKLWWVSRVGPQTSGLGGWPVKLQLSHSCAACLGVQVQLCFPGDETRREIRDRQQIQGRNESRRGAVPHQGGEGRASVDVRYGICRLSWSARDTAVRIVV
jgi:hypothetical protein